MDLPDYFLADLPDASALSAKLITEACATLKQNRQKFLLGRTTDSLIDILVRLSQDWLDPEFSFRQIVLQRGPAETGFSEQTLKAGLDRFFKQITRASIEALIEQDLGSVRRLDEIVSSPIEVRENRASIAHGHDLVVHIAGGVLPNPTFASIIVGLLARSAQFVKCPKRAAFLPRMFAHSLYSAQPKLGACLEVADWKGGNEQLENALFAEASCLTATGSDETLASIHKRLPARVRFLPYGTKLSFAYIARESLAAVRRKEVVSLAAEDILAWNQLGCLSPHVIYAETGGAASIHTFAEMLAAELDHRERDQPRGQIHSTHSAAIATRRMFHQTRASVEETTRLWSSSNSTAWTVVYEEDPAFQLSCLNRFIYVKPVADLDHLMTAIASLQGSVSTVGVSAPAQRFQEIAFRLARWGVSRICPVGQMQNPPLAWRHDGRPALADLITWTDVELR